MSRSEHQVQAHVNHLVAIICGNATYQGTRCGRGHDGTRYTSGCGCVACTKAARQRDYDKIRGPRQRSFTF